MQAGNTVVLAQSDAPDIGLTVAALAHPVVCRDTVGARLPRYCTPGRGADRAGGPPGCLGTGLRGHV